MAVAALGVFWWQGPCEHDKLQTFYYLPTKDQAEQIETEIQNLADHLDYPAERELAQAYHELGLLALHRTSQHVIEAKDMRVKAQASLFAATNGAMAYVAAGYRECERFVKALRRLIELSERADMPVVRYLYSHRDEPGVRDTAAGGGNFLKHAVKTGLVHSGMGQSDYLVTKALFMYRWMGFAGFTPSEARNLLPSGFLGTGLGWLVERAKNMTVQKRHMVLRLLEISEPDYPSGKMRVLILMETGQWDKAWRMWRISSEQGTRP